MDDNLEKKIEDEIMELVNDSFEIPVYKRKKINKEILVLAGGGVKGIIHLGVADALLEQNILHNITTFAGTSIGGVICAFLNLGYGPGELFQFVKSFPLQKLKNINILNIFGKYGFDNGNKLTILFQQMIEAKGFPKTLTLNELFLFTGKLLYLTTVNLTRMKVVYLSHLTHPDLPLYLAFRMTTSVPIYFEPPMYNGDHYVDGGCMDNYPVHMFGDKLDKVIGVYLTPQTDNFYKIKSIEDYVFRLIQCIVEGVALNYTKNYENYTISIPSSNLNFIDLNLSDSDKYDLFKSGYDSTAKYLKKNKV